MTVRALLLFLLAAGVVHAAPTTRPPDAPRSPLGRTYPRPPDRAALASEFKFAILDPVMANSTAADRPLIDRIVFEMRRAANVQVVGLGVMTKETMVEMLGAEGTAACEGQCASTTGQKVGADYIVDGHVRRTATGQLETELRLWQTKNGVQLSTILAAGANDQALIADLKASLPDLLKPVQLMLDAELRAAKEQADTREAQAQFDAQQTSAAQRERLAAEAQAREEMRQKQLEQDRIRQEAQAQARVEAAKSEEAAIGRHSVLRKVGWTLLGVGILSGGIAGAAAIRGEDITSHIQSGGYSTGATIKSQSESVATVNAIAKISAATATGLVLGGLGLLLFNQDAAKPETARLEIGPQGVLVAGRF